MIMQEEIRDKFLDLLRELFEFDCADLDFGIYRIMNYKRAVIERFITEDLPKTIAEELQRGALAEQGQVQKELEEARQKVIRTLGEGALGAVDSSERNLSAILLRRKCLQVRTRAQSACLDGDFGLSYLANKSQCVSY
ncbi:MAG: hypothetical protein RML47_06430 [Bacteroidota bacterium]|nr:hypothetical protein [Rhodothermia bacterium]MDW8137325.1 hypothetical protein [Bacteroidota bacterium]MDW8285721.1 hypothetical protein [Bacteroidota bacterium]